jgi:hypothetical protein
MAPTQSHAYSRIGGKWAGGKITYYNGIKGYDPAVKAAVSAWNHSGAKVKFVRVSKKKARVKIRYMRDSSCDGLTRLPQTRRTTRATVYLPAPSAPDYCRDKSTITIYAAHELGHVLGLGHETRTCALMNPQGSRQGGSLCAEPGGTQPWLWRCRIIEPDDLRGAIRIYGGKVKLSKFKASPWCPVYAAPPPVTGLSASPTSDHRIQISMTRPLDGLVPGYLARQFSVPEPFAYVAYAPGPCPAITSAIGYAWRSIPVGGLLSNGVINNSALTPGTTYCVSVWAADAIGQPSAPSTASVKVT